MTEFQSLEFLADKSKEMVEKQIESFRQKQSKSGIIIGVCALFIPFFITGMEDSYKLIQFLSFAPILALIIVIIIMLLVLRTTKLFQFFSAEKFQELVNMEYDEILVYEIGANTSSFRDNKIIDEKLNKLFNLGLWILTVSIIFSAILLSTNKLYHPTKKNNTFENYCIKNMKIENNEKKPIFIPNVPPSEREQLNEGVDKPKINNPPSPKNNPSNPKK